MKQHVKSEQLGVRISPNELRRIKQAAKLETARRCKVVKHTTLFYELGMAGIDRILADADPAQSDRRAGERRHLPQVAGSAR